MAEQASQRARKGLSHTYLEVEPHPVLPFVGAFGIGLWVDVKVCDDLRTAIAAVHLDCLDIDVASVKVGRDGREGHGSLRARTHTPSSIPDTGSAGAGAWHGQHYSVVVERHTTASRFCMFKRVAAAV